jgi:uncharacterized protein (DUF58 family)
VSPSTTPGRPPPPWRSVNAAITGVVAGACGVIVARAVFGPRVVAAGVLFGGLALVAGAALSWALSNARRRPADPARLPGGRQLRGRAHPVHWFGPIAGSALAMLAWTGVAHSSGSGWVQAIGALLAAVLLTGIVAPLFPARRAGVCCTENPSDSEAGSTVTLTLLANGPMRLRPKYPVGPVARAEGSSHGPRVVTVDVTPDRRGVFDHLAVELASCAPFGLLWWAKEVEVALVRPLHVAPRASTAGPIETATGTSAGDADLRIPAGLGEPRGVRPYEPGDARRSVHWPATSHVGSLMVRETERQMDDPIVVDVVLPRDPAEAEAESERVMAAVTQYLARGRSVVLGTHEADGRVVRLVRDRVDLGRRLARAVPTPVDPLTPAPSSRGKRRRNRS